MCDSHCDVSVIVLESQQKIFQYFTLEFYDCSCNILNICWVGQEISPREAIQIVMAIGKL